MQYDWKNRLRLFITIRRSSVAEFNFRKFGDRVSGSMAVSRSWRLFHSDTLADSSGTEWSKRGNDDADIDLQPYLLIVDPPQTLPHDDNKNNHSVLFSVFLYISSCHKIWKVDDVSSIHEERDERVKAPALQESASRCENCWLRQEENLRTARSEKGMSGEEKGSERCDETNGIPRAHSCQEASSLLPP